MDPVHARTVDRPYVSIKKNDGSYLPHFTRQYRDVALRNILDARKTGTVFEGADSCLNFILPEGDFTPPVQTQSKRNPLKRTVKLYFEKRGTSDPKEIMNLLEQKFVSTEIDRDTLYPFGDILKSMGTNVVSVSGFLRSSCLEKGIEVYRQNGIVCVPGKYVSTVKRVAIKIKRQGKKPKSNKHTYSRTAVNLPHVELNYDITSKLEITTTQMNAILQKNSGLRRHVRIIKGGKRVVPQEYLEKFIQDVKKTGEYQAWHYENKKRMYPTPPSA